MSIAKRHYVRVNRPAQAGELVGVRLQPEQLARIDAWRAGGPRTMTRPEAIRALTDLALGASGAAPSLFDLSELVFIDGLERSAPAEPRLGAEDALLPALDELWPGDLRDSFIMLPDPDENSRLHEIPPMPEPLPEQRADRLGPLGPIRSSGRRR